MWYISVKPMNWFQPESESSINSRPRQTDATEMIVIRDMFLVQAVTLVILKTYLNKTVSVLKYVIRQLNW